MPRHTDILVVHDSTLQEIAQLIGADYTPGAFDAAVEALHEEPDRWEQDWYMRGPRGTYFIYIERHEGYLTCSVTADEPAFGQVVALMKRDRGGAGHRG